MYRLYCFAIKYCEINNTAESFVSKCGSVRTAVPFQEIIPFTFSLDLLFDILYFYDDIVIVLFFRNASAAILKKSLNPRRND